MIRNKITYKPDWRHYRFLFTIALLLVPIGLGIILYFILRFRLNQMIYVIFDDAVEIHAPERASIPLEDIRSVSTTDPVTFLGKTVKSVQITTDERIFTLYALIEADTITSVLKVGIEAIQKQQEMTRERDRMAVKADPGSLERLNDLVGLWQQGLISEDDYLSERKKFDK